MVVSVPSALAAVTKIGGAAGASVGSRGSRRTGQKGCRGDYSKKLENELIGTHISPYLL